MRRDYPKQFYVTGFMLASLLIGIAFFITNHLDFIIAAFEQTKFNLPNISYGIIRLITCLLMPAVFVSPSIFMYSRVRLTKLFFAIQGILHLLTLTWLVNFFLSGYTYADLLSQETVVFFQQNYANAYISAQIFWDTYDLISVLFTVLLSIFYFVLAKYFDDNRIIVRRLTLSLLLFKVIVPLVYGLIAKHSIYSATWITNNFAELLSMAAFTAGIYIASLDDTTWIASIWDEHIQTNDEEF